MNDEKQANAFEKDMLGDPADQKNELLGAPKFKITLVKQRLVGDLRAHGWSQERIAAQLECSVKTLTKYFSLELHGASDRTEALAITAIANKMREGNSAAASKILNMVQKGRAAVPLPSDLDETTEAEDAPDKMLGKKEQQKKGAENPGAAWGDLLSGSRLN